MTKLTQTLALTDLRFSDAEITFPGILRRERPRLTIGGIEKKRNRPYEGILLLRNENSLLLHLRQLNFQVIVIN